MNLKLAKKKSEAMAKALNLVLRDAKGLADNSSTANPKLLKIYDKSVDLSIAASECQAAGICCRKASNGLMIMGWK